MSRLVVIVIALLALGSTAEANLAAFSVSGSPVGNSFVYATATISTSACPPSDYTQIRIRAVNNN